MRRALNSGGYLLLDAVVAMGILGVALFALSGLFIQSTRVTRAANLAEYAAVFAQQAFEELSRANSQGEPLEAMTTLGHPAVLECAGVTFERSISVSRRVDLDSTGNLLEARVRLTWSEGGIGRARDYLTYFVVDTAIEGLR